MMKKLICFLLAFISLDAFCQTSVLPAPNYTETKRDGRELTVGMRFVPKQRSIIKGAFSHSGQEWTGWVVALLYDAYGNLLATAQFEKSVGLMAANFNFPYIAEQGQEYTIAVCSEVGNYYSQPEFFPKSYPLYDAVGSRYVYEQNSYPNVQHDNSNYYVEPIIVPYVNEVVFPDSSGVIRDTIVIVRDTCVDFDYSQVPHLTFVPSLGELGGTFIMPDSTTMYMAAYGAAPPHVRFKNDTSLIADRFYRGTGVNRRRCTLYVTGAWIVERYVVNKWVAVRQRYNSKTGVWRDYTENDY